MKSPYEILGVTEEQSQQEIEERYKELKAKYGEQRFAAGEEKNSVKSKTHIKP